MVEKEISNLLEKFKEGTLSEEEKKFLNTWYIHYAKEKHSSLNIELLEENLEALRNSVKQEIKSQESLPEYPKIRRLSTWSRVAVAASILLAMFSGWYFLGKQGSDGDKGTEKNSIAQTDIKPGSNKAFLILADGSKISLTDAENGQLAKHAGVVITKTKDGQLVYTITDAKNGTTGFNTIETPRGGQYQVNLPDGSKVWLNSETRLKFPVSFADQKERRVELSGEAYFEVAKQPVLEDKKHTNKRFIVASKGQEVQVLGTHFNISAYADESYTRTTLLEGSVRVLQHAEEDEGHMVNSVKLCVGQQANLTSEGLVRTNVDTEAAVAWKNGQFMFAGDPLEEVMRKISRWYDVDLEYRADFSEVVIGGSVPRFTDINDVLEVLALAGKVNFKIEGKKIIISPPRTTYINQNR